MIEARIVPRSDKADSTKIWFLLVDEDGDVPAKSLDFIKLKMWAEAHNYDLVDEKPRKKLRWKVFRGNLAMPLKKNAGPPVPLEEWKLRQGNLGSKKK